MNLKLYCYFGTALMSKQCTKHSRSSIVRIVKQTKRFFFLFEFQQYYYSYSYIDAVRILLFHLLKTVILLCIHCNKSLLLQYNIIIKIMHLETELHTEQIMIIILLQLVYMQSTVCCTMAGCISLRASDANWFVQSVFQLICSTCT